MISSSFDLLVERHRDSMLLLAFRITGNQDDAKDATQDAFMRAYLKFSQCGRERPFAGWLSVIVRNAALDILRRRKVRAMHVTDTEVRPEPGPEELALLQDGASRIRDAVRNLPDRYCTALELYYFEGLSYREIAERLSVPLGTVKTFLFRALQKLKDEESIVRLRLAA